ncbi:sporulation protein YqfD [Pelotomaculum terephthalicicum JT]|uniref:sporulation protein YqfD n=1 Tax=Pelotomaculum TaxID=191373 RepID=UPI0009C56E26|nr:MULTISPECIES: sporulation protein YqfD [Pelotomaculum]MCG9967047.1 sporulation protein YqfD [Pelotomaculum terephthalicicum JT]OPX90506.1 MAG: putative stage IV sporulation protein YqfD [Pelotomaculum sp. PtaB.Bin117]OPY63908.1 MAG: putative stage IV sporulation protein YqfD [Pelotomaculum sp. PtaU1.Bin065]
MMFFKLMSYFIGYVVIIVTGKAPERFINMAASRGIYLWDISRTGENAFLLKVRLHAVKPLRHIARRTGCRYSIESRKGLPFSIVRIRRRKALALGFVFFLGTLYFLSSFVWFIEVRGNERLTAAEVLGAAADSGLSRGKPKWKIEPEQVEARILERLPLVAWTGVYIKGTKVTIEVAERIVPEEEDRRPSHIVAAKAGMIKEVLVLNGNPLIKEGDTVAPGQVLISGEIPPLLDDSAKQGEGNKKEEPKAIRPAYYVHARGIVRARVWYEGYGEAQVIETGYRFTGRSKKRVSLKYNSQEKILLDSENIPFEHYEVVTSVKKLPQWRNLDPPVELVTVKYLELAAYCDERSREDTCKAAEEAALEAVMKQLPRDAIVQGRWLEDVSAGRDENVVRVKAVLETVEDIGKEKLFKP